MRMAAITITSAAVITAIDEMRKPHHRVTDRDGALCAYLKLLKLRRTAAERSMTGSRTVAAHYAFWRMTPPVKATGSRQYPSTNNQREFAIPPP